MCATHKRVEHTTASWCTVCIMSWNKERHDDNEMKTEKEGRMGTRAGVLCSTHKRVYYSKQVYCTSTKARTASASVFEAGLEKSRSTRHERRSIRLRLLAGT